MKEIIVVEGKDDTRRLKEVFINVDTIETNGSALSSETLELIKKANEYRGVIVLTDPDFPGGKIRQEIMHAIPTVKHAFLTKKEALGTKKGSLGVEHASDMAIKRALKQVMSVYLNETCQKITKNDLMALGLIGTTQSSKLREQVANHLGIGHVNGKQLEKRLAMFGIQLDQLKDVVEYIKEIE